MSTIEEKSRDPEIVPAERCELRIKGVGEIYRKNHKIVHRVSLVFWRAPRRFPLTKTEECIIVLIA